MCTSGIKGIMIILFIHLNFSFTSSAAALNSSMLILSCSAFYRKINHTLLLCFKHQNAVLTLTQIYRFPCSAVQHIFPHTLQTFFSKVSISFLSWSSLNFISFSFSSRISLKLCPCSVVVPCPLILVCRSASTFLPYDYWIDKCKSWKICQCQAHTNRIYKMIRWTVSLRFMVE